LNAAYFGSPAPFSLSTEVTIMQNTRCAANDGIATDVRDQLMDHVPRLRRYSRALIRNHDLADDLVQDTLQRALQRLEQFERDTDLRAWLFTIMHNLFANQRRHASMHAVHVSVDDEGVPETEFAVAANQTHRLEVRDLDAALQMLSVEQRQVVLLVGLEEMSYTDAAFALNIPVGTVMSRLSRGRERLRELMMGRSVGHDAAKARMAAA
jgi:RNA polymerase sigma-70 factor (ECF subfamily)